MGKKKGFVYYNSKAKDKKKKKNKKKEYDIPKFKMVQPSLGRKDAKIAKKIVLAPVDVPKAFLKVRRKCNHAGKLITVAEFKEMTPAYAAYTPMLDSMIMKYGEENVMVCKSCYDVIVEQSKIDAGDVDDAIMSLYAAANKVVSMHRMKDDEVEAIAKIKEGLTEWAEVSDLIYKIDAEQAARAAATESRNSANLNNVGNDVTVY